MKASLSDSGSAAATATRANKATLKKKSFFIYQICYVVGLFDILMVLCISKLLLQLTNRNMVELELGLLGCTPSNDYVEELSIESKFHLPLYTYFHDL